MVLREYFSNATFRSREASNFSFYVYNVYRKALEELSLMYSMLDLSSILMLLAPISLLLPLPDANFTLPSPAIYNSNNCHVTVVMMKEIIDGCWLESLMLSIAHAAQLIADRLSDGFNDLGLGWCCCQLSWIEVVLPDAEEVSDLEATATGGADDITCWILLLLPLLIAGAGREEEGHAIAGATAGWPEKTMTLPDLLDLSWLETREKRAVVAGIAGSRRQRWRGVGVETDLESWPYCRPVRRLRSTIGGIADGELAGSYSEEDGGGFECHSYCD
ncbi:hypothetical protein ACLOJK_026363 [Asimina triloba]